MRRTVQISKAKITNRLFKDFSRLKELEVNRTRRKVSQREEFFGGLILIQGASAESADRTNAPQVPFLVNPL